MVEFVTVNAPSDRWLYMPPPLAAAEFPETVELAIVNVPAL